MKVLNKYFLVWSLLLFFSCNSMKTVSLYDTVVEKDKEDPFLSFPFKDIFTDSDKTGVFGTKTHPCKEITFDTINNFSGKDHLHLKWEKTKNCKWLGLGFKWGNFKSKNLAPIFENSAIQFMIRSNSGEFYNIPMLFALSDYSGKQCFSKVNILGMEDGVVDQKWRKVSLPLSTFNYNKKGVKISNIKELRIQLMKKGNFHIDDVKLVPYNHPYKISTENFTKEFNTLPINLGDEKKYWWGVNESFSSNLMFTTKSNSIKNKTVNDDNPLLEPNVSLSLSVNYDSESIDKKWNSFGFPFNKWECADLSEVYTNSALNFKITGKKVPKIKINLVSYLGKPRNISKLISENNIVQLNENTFEIFIPIKSFKNFSSLNWSKMKELRFSILESSNFKIVDFKLIEFRGDPDNPTKWFKQ
jgi:hypothetical protein